MYARGIWIWMMVAGIWMIKGVGWPEINVDFSFPCMCVDHFIVFDDDLVRLAGWPVGWLGF